MRFSGSLVWESKLGEGEKWGKWKMSGAGNVLSFVANAEDAGDGRGLGWGQDYIDVHNYTSQFAVARR
jgi:hypothetical protein